ncbi:hypothetical protein ABZ608_36725 [Streptomyces sp. NPDC013172]|uniref:hypothetical protein n=1 Tax=Streptomyces sp. NPDC013172 TaxID=3155009 RepID=UPI00340878C6
MSGGGEAAHVRTDLGDQDLGQGQADSGDGDQQLDPRTQGQQLSVDLLAQAGDPRVGLIDRAEHRGDHERVVLAEAAGQRPGQQRDLAVA